MTLILTLNTPKALFITADGLARDRGKPLPAKKLFVVGKYVLGFSGRLDENTIPQVLGFAEKAPQDTAWAFATFLQENLPPLAVGKLKIRVTVAAFEGRGSVYFLGSDYEGVGQGFGNFGFTGNGSVRLEKIRSDYRTTFVNPAIARSLAIEETRRRTVNKNVGGKMQGYKITDTGVTPLRQLPNFGVK